MHTNFKVIGLTLLGIKPKSTALEADARTTRPSELSKILLTLSTQNQNSNNYAKKFTPIYTLNSSSRMFYDILKKKQEEKSHDMQKLHQTTINTIVTSKEKSYDLQKFTPNRNKHYCDVTSTNFNPMKLRNGEICPEYSRKNYVSRKLRLHNATLQNNPTNNTSENNASV